MKLFSLFFIYLFIYLFIFAHVSIQMLKAVISFMPKYQKLPCELPRTKI